MCPHHRCYVCPPRAARTLPHRPCENGMAEHHQGCALCRASPHTRALHPTHRRLGTESTAAGRGSPSSDPAGQLPPGAGSDGLGARGLSPGAVAIFGHRRSAGHRHHHSAGPPLHRSGLLGTRSDGIGAPCRSADGWGRGWRGGEAAMEKRKKGSAAFMTAARLIVQIPQVIRIIMSTYRMEH